ncbi:MAG: choline dehydrogenase-like flavoprotein/pimeloyl-ACP methyl ester carboxylesterase [Halioglobus sp.]|jgi:choline dehydrogenase-like flavoprotein/pimeloyl-ACP methyl ester carboxylesterase
MKPYPHGTPPSPLNVDQATEFLSSRFEILVAELALRRAQTSSTESSLDDIDFDVIVVGSGYGGAVAAAQFASTKMPDSDNFARVCLLERGTERLPGSFPDSLSQLPGEVRLYNSQTDGSGTVNNVRGNLSGLFDVRLGDGYSALVANGLGGGSLINAGVMLQPAKSVFTESVWPMAIQTDMELDALFEESRELVGASMSNRSGVGANIPITIAMTGQKLPKYEALKSLGATSTEAVPVPITIKICEKIPDQTISTNKCIQCGDCFSGCNHNAKRSLDTNLLATASIRGAKLYCGATVLSIDKQASDVWELTCTYTDASMQKHLLEPVRLRCRKLIIAAGTLGSTELLLRSEQDSNTRLRFSDRLGERFSGNGDMIATISDRNTSVNSVANESIAPNSRGIGPTITGMLDLRSSDAPLVIQELAVPAVLRRLLIQTTAFTQTISAITQFKKSITTFSEHFFTLNPLGPVGPGDTGPSASILAMSDAETDRISILALMGDDSMEGRLSLPEKSGKHTTQGRLDIKFPVRPDTESGTDTDAQNEADSTTPDFYNRSMSRLKQLLKRSDPGAWLHSNPLWKPLGLALESLFDVKVQGMQITVHPLGGCAMGESHLAGVVDDSGRVFDPDSSSTTGVHEGLVVLDGSIIPNSLGVNPALTITALALRATRRLAVYWGWNTDTTINLNDIPSVALERPYVRLVSVDSAPVKRATQVELVERLVGSVTLSTPTGQVPCIVELRLRSTAFDVVAFTRFLERKIPLLSEPAPDVNHTLPDRSYLRIIPKQDWDRHHDINSIMEDRAHDPEWAINKRQLIDHYDRTLDGLAVVSAPVSGHIRLLEEEPLLFPYRLCMGIYAWWLNRGKRDASQSWAENSGNSIVSRIKGVLLFISPQSLAAFANSGRERRLSYHLVIGPTESIGPLAGLQFKGRHIDGVKSFAYRRQSNPWRQLMDINLTNFPHSKKSHLHTLQVDPSYFARAQVPLLHIVDEDNLIDGTADLFDFYAHMARVFLFQQLWTLRKPDTPTTKKPISKNIQVNVRLPAELPGISRTIYPINIRDTLPELTDKAALQAQLTRYTGTHGGSGPPILCIHGYSASGSTFAHGTLYGGDNKKGGLAQYLCDLGHDVWILDMRSSSAFECAKAPWDFEHMAYNDIPAAIEKIHHETGLDKIDVVAHCMGAVMLSMALLGKPKGALEQSAISNMHSKINRIVLSQAGPFLQFTPMNTMRSWVLGFVKQLLPKQGYEFNPDRPSSEHEVIMDRLLNTLPYPDSSEFDRENPKRGYTTWVKTRHRMDALYGRTFSLASMSDEILDHIDDFFGPFNFQTLEQTLPISKRRQISSRFGTDFNITAEELHSRWEYPTLWIHGEHNGLIDPISPSLSALRFDESNNKQLQIKIIANKGHQDCLMSSDCREPFEAISRHLTSDIPITAPTTTHVQSTSLAHPVLLERSETDADKRFVFVQRHDPNFDKLRRLALVPLTGDDQLPSSTNQIVLIDVAENGCFPLPDNVVSFPALALLMVAASSTESEDMQCIQHWLDMPSSHHTYDFKILR